MLMYISINMDLVGISKVTLFTKNFNATQKRSNCAMAKHDTAIGLVEKDAKRLNKSDNIKEKISRLDKDETLKKKLIKLLDEEPKNRQFTVDANLYKKLKNIDGINEVINTEIERERPLGNIYSLVKESGKT